MTDRLSGPKPLSPAEIIKRKAEAAERALSEAATRRADENTQKTPTKELGGRPGPEPTRYGDWEKKGMICDF